MKTIIQSRKTRGFTYRHQCGEAAVDFSSCSFLMCFSLPESNSFPGPRQLHINWPRRRCQGYSAQVLWRRHRQLNIDLEVCSYSLYLPVSLPLSPSCYLQSPSSFVSAYVPSLCMYDCSCPFLPPKHMHRPPSSRPSLHSLIPLHLLFSLFIVSILLMSPLSASSPPFPPRSPPSLCLSVRSILSRSFTAGRSSLRPAPSRTFHRGQHSTTRAGERLSLKISSFPRSTRLGAGGRGVFGRAWLRLSVIIRVR